MAKKAAGIIAGILIFLLCMEILNEVFRPKWCDDTCTTLMADGFYAEESYDAVFFGTSQVLFSISPMEIYDAYGLKTYDCATGGQSIVDTYYWVREAIDRYHPPVVVVEIFGAMDEEAVSEPSIREAVDSMRFGKNKLLAIRDTIKNYDIESDALSFLIPFLRYHDRWNELTKEDFLYPFQKGTYVMRGFVPSTNVYVNDDIVCGVETFDPKVPPVEITDYQADYLERIISYCRSKDTELVFLKTPVYAYESKHHNVIQRVADQYGVPFLDMNDEKGRGEIDRCDFDGLPHMNLAGAKKTSAMIGEYLLDHYPFLSERTLANREDERWQEELRSYREIMADTETEMERALREEKSREAGS